jgi:hypothetical protein
METAEHHADPASLMAQAQVVVGLGHLHLVVMPSFNKVEVAALVRVEGVVALEAPGVELRVPP